LRDADLVRNHLKALGVRRCPKCGSEVFQLTVVYTLQVRSDGTIEQNGFHERLIQATQCAVCGEDLDF